MSELRTKLVDIQTEKNTKLTPENLREGVTCLGVTGILKEKIDTSDATATAADIIKNKTAYINDELVTGTMHEVTANTTLAPFGDAITLFNNPDMETFAMMSETTFDTALRAGSDISMTVPYADIAESLGLTSEQIIEGNTVLGIEGTGQTGIDTSDATATVKDIVSGKTAYVNGEKIEGTVLELRSTIGITYDRLWPYNNGDNDLIAFGDMGIDVLMRPGSEVQLNIPIKNIVSMIGLTSDKITSGNTILGIEGTAPITFATVEEMNSNTAYPENTFAIVYGTEYVGTYKLDNGAWTQIGDATDGAEMMRVLNETDGDILEYEGNGGTDEEINAVLEDILTNPNVSEDDSDLN